MCAAQPAVQDLAGQFTPQQARSVTPAGPAGLQRLINVPADQAAKLPTTGRDGTPPTTADPTPVAGPVECLFAVEGCLDIGSLTSTQKSSTIADPTIGLIQINPGAGIRTRLIDASSYNPDDLLLSLRVYANQATPESQDTPESEGDSDGDEDSTDVFVRRGSDWESTGRLAKQAGQAEETGRFGHGVSVTSPESNQRLSRDPDDAVSATRREIEDAGFALTHTPTNNDPDHHTLILPKPVTSDVARAFNQLFGRTR